jgi:ABC-type multidrug transport system fused ATPase/permease subunit
VEPGERVAVVGPSGVGKTTLLSLILRFYKPTKGEIHFDGRPASVYEVGSLRQRIGYVSQRTRLVSGTIMENICYGNPEASEDQVVQAARVAGIHEFISMLPEGYETKLGEDGVNLSEGQKQRLSISRAISAIPGSGQDPVCGDEPTSRHRRFRSRFTLERESACRHWYTSVTLGDERLLPVASCRQGVRRLG